MNYVLIIITLSMSVGVTGSFGKIDRIDFIDFKSITSCEVAKKEMDKINNDKNFSGGLIAECFIK